MLESSPRSVPTQPTDFASLLTHALCAECGGTGDHVSPEQSQCAGCGRLLPWSLGETIDPFVGTTIENGRYRVEAVIGEGGMGTVYRASQSIGDRIRSVAVKTLHHDRAHNPDTYSRFFTEVGTLSLLEHPNTVRVYESGRTADGRHFAVMEYVEGIRLTDLIAEGNLHESRIEHMLSQICGALQEAHAYGIVHRDVKPDNIVVMDRGAKRDFIKVLDFGISHRLGDNGNDKVDGSADSDADPFVDWAVSSRLTVAGQLLGTPAYMAPERFCGHPGSPASDVYALAIIAYEMLTGERPYPGGSIGACAKQHLSGRPRPIDAILRGRLVHPARRLAVMRALARHPESRPQDAASFLEEFNRREVTDIIAFPPGVSAAASGATATSAANEDATLKSAPSRTLLAAHRLRTVSATNSGALAHLIGAARLGVEAEAETNHVDAATKRRWAAWSAITALEEALVRRLVGASSNPNLRALWIQWGQPPPRRGKDRRPLGQIWLDSHLRNPDNLPSLQVIAGWFCARHRIQPPELAQSLQENIGVPVGLEEDLFAAGALRNTLAHAVQRVHQSNPLDGATGLAIFSNTGGYGAIEIPDSTLILLEWLCVSVLERRSRPRPVLPNT